MFAAENWCLKVQEKVYGPYTTQQMRKFAQEGRLAHWSLIAPAGSRAWREAREENAFASMFGMDATSATRLRAGKAFGRRDDIAEEETAEEAEKPQRKAASRPAGAAAEKRQQEKHVSRIANFVIVFDVVSAAASRVEAAILSLGNAFRLADNVWSVSCELTAVGVRNAIAPYLSGSESIFVIDATRGRTSWQNYSPEAQAKISSAYLSGKYQ